MDRLYVDLHTRTVEIPQYSHYPENHLLLSIANFNKIHDLPMKIRT